MMRVLVAMDDSAISRHAGREAVKLFLRPDTEFLVINVAPLPVPWSAASALARGPLPDRGWPLEPSDIEEHKVEELARRAGIEDPVVLTTAGDPVERICQAADEHDVDVVVVGGEARSVVGRLLQPSVSAGVVRASVRPVLVVSGSPGQVADGGPPPEASLRR